MLFTTINCDHCAQPFSKPNNEINRSIRLRRKQYCSHACSGLARSALPRVQSEPNTICAFCGKTFYKKKSSKNSTKNNVYFCCRAHKDQAQRIGGIKEIMPPHYGTATSPSYYRPLAFANYAHECAQCGYNKYPDVLCVHHIDCDRTHNTLDNLVILCPTCHVEIHFKQGTGFWQKRKGLED